MRRHSELLMIGTTAVALMVIACDEKVQPVEKTRREETMRPSVSCQLDLEEHENRIMVELKFTNNGKESVPITTWKLIVDGKMTWSAFEVTRESVAISYKCLTIKRGSPSDRDFYILKPGETYTSTIEISACYDFSEPGVYQVLYRSVNAMPEEGWLLEIVSNKAELMIREGL